MQRRRREWRQWVAVSSSSLSSLLPFLSWTSALLSGKKSSVVVVPSPRSLNTHSGSGEGGPETSHSTGATRTYRYPYRCKYRYRDARVTPHSAPMWGDPHVSYSWKADTLQK